MASTLMSSSTLCFFIGPEKQIGISHRNRRGVIALPSVGSSHVRLRIRTIAWFGKRDKSAEEVEADRRKVQEFFEKIGRAERERVSKQLELERKATVQAERDYMIVRWWNKIFSKIFGKLRGTPWDPEPAHNISFSEFWKLLERGKVNYLDYADYGQQVAVILPYYEDMEGPIVKKGWKEKLEAERPIVYKRHIVEKMPADATTDVWSLLHKQLHDVQIFNTKSVPMHLYPQLHIAVVWTMRLAVAVCIYLLLDRILFPIYTVGDKERPRQEKPSLTASSRPLGAFGESRARFISGEEKTGVTFEDFAGQNYVKRELKDVVKLLKQTKKDPKGLIATLVPRGVLLHGPPGTGKTLLAKAIAGEAGVPFFFASGSEFVEMFAGVAAARVQDLFSRAREFSPSIIFIDEIDAIGARRGGRDAGGGGAEREQGLVQMLTELDGFQKSNATVLLIGATNRIDILDPALLRKGRFDKILRVSTPTEEGRLEILKVHSRNKSFNSEQEKEMLLREVAAATKGYSGADLANIMNEAAILTIREDKDVIEKSELLEAQDRQRGVFTTGQEDVLGVTREACARVAYREAAVAVLDCYFPKQHSPFIKTNVKLIDGELNMRYVDPPFRVFGKKQDYIDAIVRRCAPRLVEEQVFGKDNVSWLSGSYLGEAGTLAEFLILQTGMTALGKISYDTDRDLVYNMHPKVQALRDEYMRYAVQKCSSVLKEYHSAVETIADRLLEKKEIYADEIWDIFNKAPRIPQSEVIPIDEYGALVYAGRWGIHGNSLPGRATFSPGNIGFVTFGAPRPKQVQLIKDETWKMMDALVKKNISKVREKVAKSGQPPVEEDMLLLPEHIL